MSYRFGFIIQQEDINEDIINMIKMDSWNEQEFLKF